MNEMRMKMRNESIPIDEVELIVINNALMHGPIGKGDAAKIKKKLKKEEIEKIGSDKYKTLHYKGKYLKKQALIDQ